MKKILTILILIFGVNFVCAQQPVQEIKKAQAHKIPKVALNFDLRWAKEKANNSIKNITAQLFDFSWLSGDIKNISETKKDYENQISQNRKDFYKKYPDIKIYLKKDLTAEDKTNIKNLVQTQVSSIKDLYQKAETAKNNWNYNNQDFLLQLEKIEKDYFDKIKQYIDSSKANNFANYVSEFIKNVKNNHTLRQEMLEKIIEIKNNLVNKISASFKDKIWKISNLILDKDKRKAFFLKILQTLKNKKDNIVNNIKESNFAQTIKVEILSNFEKIINEYIANIK